MIFIMGLFGKKLFGNNIEVSCDYCERAKVINNEPICTMNKSIEAGKCIYFVYNPLLRIPRTMPNLPLFDPKDFEL